MEKNIIQSSPVSKLSFVKMNERKEMRPLCILPLAKELLFYTDELHP